VSTFALYISHIAKLAMQQEKIEMGYENSMLIILMVLGPTVSADSLLPTKTLCKRTLTHTLVLSFVKPLLQARLQKRYGRGVIHQLQAGNAAREGFS
jgi:uncharacterized membrane protein YraQ (UPF0718 family)